MTASILYLASLAGAVGLFLVMRPHGRSTRMVGTILGAGAVAFLMVRILQTLSEDAAVPVLEIVFGIGGIAGAVRMVTHPRPVFAAIWFVMVVVCSAGMFLLLDAEFMAFSLVIVYAGAILITYLFVLMLAQEATGSAGEALYDRLPREPVAALVVGFVLLASIGDALLVIDGGVDPDGKGSVTEAATTRWEILDGLPKQLNETAERLVDARAAAAGDPAPDEVTVVRNEDGHAIKLDGTTASIDVEVDGTTMSVTLPEDAMPSNTQQVGWALVAVFPVSLEVAGVILLMAMFGAVVLARRQIDLGEDERRVAAGLGPLLEDEDSDLMGGAS
ncbi:MAG: NADH-quinone oxidoreductase subunit J [Phycisphaera sp.]|nr:NADH-quinone oxidoreductase subunit J [Phycisphaera sp.]